MSILGATYPERVRRAGTLVIAGLVVVLPTLFWNHAMSFILFSTLGLTLCGAGALLFLFAAVMRSP